MNFTPKPLLKPYNWQSTLKILWLERFLNVFATLIMKPASLTLTGNALMWIHYFFAHWILRWNISLVMLFFLFYILRQGHRLWFGIRQAWLANNQIEFHWIDFNRWICVNLYMQCCLLPSLYFNLTIHQSMKKNSAWFIAKHAYDDYL